MEIKAVEPSPPPGAAPPRPASTARSGAVSLFEFLAGLPLPLPWEGDGGGSRGTGGTAVGQRRMAGRNRVNSSCN